MPTYSYKCSDCGHTYDALQSIKSEPDILCPECGGRVDRLIGGGAGIHFKGSGFYVTDYKSSGSSSGKSSTSGSDPSSGSSPDKAGISGGDASGGSSSDGGVASGSSSSSDSSSGGRSSDKAVSAGSSSSSGTSAGS